MFDFVDFILRDLCVLGFFLAVVSWRRVLGCAVFVCVDCSALGCATSFQCVGCFMIFLRMFLVLALRRLSYACPNVWQRSHLDRGTWSSCTRIPFQHPGALGTRAKLFLIFVCVFFFSLQLTAVRRLLSFSDAWTFPLALGWLICGLFLIGC